MTTNTTVALIGAVSAVASAFLTGYFAVQASRSSKAAHDTAISTVQNGYSATIRPALEDTKDNIDLLHTRLDQFQELFATARREGARPLRDPVTPAAPRKVLHIPEKVKFQSARMGDLEPGTNRQGHDLSNFIVDGPQACSESCDTNVHCLAMTMVKRPGGGGICWLKDSVPPMSQHTDMVSAIKIFQ